jgi:hypothetical protein
LRRRSSLQEVPLHRIIAGVIMLAVALPTKMVIARLFELSNDSVRFA